MERSDMNWTIETQHESPKSRYDRYVCAVASGNSTRHPDLMMDVAEISEWAIQLMLAADKRWEEYTKGGEDVDTK